MSFRRFKWHIIHIKDKMTITKKGKINATILKMIDVLIIITHNGGMKDKRGRRNKGSGGQPVS